MTQLQAEERTRKANLEHTEAFRFRVTFGGDIPELMLDEPPPLGAGSGPNAASLLAAAVGNCLSASLLLCLNKSKVEVRGMTTAVTLTLGRNERGRLRVTRGDVRIAVGAGADAHLERCLGLFEDYCIVTATVRQAFPIEVTVTDGSGRELHHSGKEELAAHA